MNNRFTTTMRRMGLTLLMLLLAATGTPTAQAEANTEREYQLKAAFLYNFLGFVDGPRFQPPSEEERQDEQEIQPIVIGVIGEDPFGAAFEPLKDKEILDRHVVVRRFHGLQWKVETDGSRTEDFPDFDEIGKCHILFVAGSERQHIALVLERIKGHSILTVSDIEGFLEIGGIINFVIEEKKVRFEINTTAAARAQLEIRSRLLRLATRVVKSDLVEEEDDGGSDASATD